MNGVTIEVKATYRDGKSRELCEFSTIVETDSISATLAWATNLWADQYRIYAIDREVTVSLAFRSPVFITRPVYYSDGWASSSGNLSAEFYSTDNGYLENTAGLHAAQQLVKRQLEEMSS